MSLLPEPNWWQVGGVGSKAATMAQQIYRNSRNQNRKSVNNRPTLSPPGSGAAMSGRQLQERARKYYFEGQAAFGNENPAYSEGGGGRGGSSISARVQSFNMTDPASNFLINNGMTPENMNIARNAANKPRVEDSMSQMPSGYYLGFGNKVRTVGDNSERKYMAGRYSDLREHGSLGGDPWANQNKETYRKLQDLRDRLANGSWMSGTGKLNPHTRPEAPGTFVLGADQGMRVRAFERREAAKVEEAKKDDLKKATDPGTPLQQEATEVERA